jgi:hypothetical protein
MKNFKMIGILTDVEAVKKEIEDNNAWWNWMSVRKKGFASRHIYVDDIVLRFQSLVLEDQPPTNMNDHPDCVNYFTQNNFPKTMELVHKLAAGKTLGRVMIASLGSGNIISPHTDQGAYCLLYDRYHIVIQTNPLAIFKCEDEEVHMTEGSIWWFDNKRVHSVENHGNIPRIHIILDVKK